MPTTHRTQVVATQPTKGSCIFDTDGRPTGAGLRFGFLRPAVVAGDIGQLGPYRVLGVLGRGGMGLVFRAVDPRLGRPVALKVMRPDVAADPSAKARFLREARAAAAVEHDHVVPIFHVDEDNGTPFLAMPLLKGQTLQSALTAGGSLPVAELLRIGREIAQGLAAAHDKGLIHRDIKPANVWLEGDQRRVRILDFGIARGAGPDEDPSEPMDTATPRPTPTADTTDPGTVLGTPAYMPPEQAAGRPVDHTADLFSLGAVLYQMATGRMPFPEDGRPRGEPDRPDAARPDLPPALTALIQRLMSAAPADRPQSAGAVVDAVRAVERRSAAPAGGRRRGWARVAIGLLAAVAAGAIGAAAVARRNPEPVPVAAEPPPVPILAPPAVTGPLTAAEQRRLAERVIQYGGQVRTHDRPDYSVRTPADLPVRPFTLCAIHLDGLPEDAAPEVVGLIARADTVDALRVFDDSLSDEDLLRIAAGPIREQLVELSLLSGGCRVTPAGLTAAVHRLPKLWAVRLDHPGLTDEVVTALAAVPHLRHAMFFQGEFGAPAARALADRRLEVLVVENNSNFDDAAVRELAACPTLGTVRLRKVPVTDAAAEAFARMPRLHTLGLTGTRMTPEGGTRVRTARPGCEVKLDQVR